VSGNDETNSKDTVHNKSMRVKKIHSHALAFSHSSGRRNRRSELVRRGLSFNIDVFASEDWNAIVVLAVAHTVFAHHTGMVGPWHGPFWRRLVAERGRGLLFPSIGGETRGVGFVALWGVQLGVVAPKRGTRRCSREAFSSYNGACMESANLYA
jgi:hypothetical protein